MYVLMCMRTCVCELKEKEEAVNLADVQYVCFVTTYPVIPVHYLMLANTCFISPLVAL